MATADSVTPGGLLPKACPCVSADILVVVISAGVTEVFCGWHLLGNEVV